MTDKFKMTEEETTVSMRLSLSLAIQIGDLLSDNVPINSIIHTMAVSLGGAICQKHQMMGDDCKQIVIDVIDFATNRIKQNQKSSIPKPSDN